MTGNRPRVPIFMAFSGNGGVERMMANLMRALVERGTGVELLATRLDGDHAAALPREVHIVDLGTVHTTRAAPAVAAYLTREKPPALLAVKDRAIRTAVRARRRARSGTRLVGALHTTLDAALAHKSRLQRWARIQPMPGLYANVERVIAVSGGVAQDAASLTGLPGDRITVIRNPVITPELHRNADEPISHPWFREGELPVIVGAGRLTRQKDFATLVRAFAAVRDVLPCRLVILGEGDLRTDLLRLARSLGVAEALDLPGFIANPFPYLRRAALFALSSAWEGSPTVLTEALALGTPVVATACPSGPDEILAGGRYGRLVPVGDAAALAKAIRATLEAPLPAEILRQAVSEYTAERAAAHYLEVLGLAGEAAHR